VPGWIIVLTRIERREKPQNRLIEEHLGLVRKCAAAAYRRLPNHPFDELLAAGYVGLVQAARKFERARGVPFEAYARIRIAGEILDSHRKLHKTKYVNEFPPDPVDTTDWFKETADNRLTEALRPTLLALTPQELHVVQLRYGHDLTMLQIAKVVKLSEGRVTQIHKKALLKMRDRAALVK
jgi:RNA polymerase sigma factor (sigma-70 family)